MQGFHSRLLGERVPRPGVAENEQLLISEGRLKALVAKGELREMRGECMEFCGYVVTAVELGCEGMRVLKRTRLGSDVQMEVSNVPLVLNLVSR